MTFEAENTAAGSVGNASASAEPVVQLHPQDDVVIARYQLVAGAQLAAAHGRKDRQYGGCQRKQSNRFIHCGISLPCHSIVGPETSS